MKPLNKVLTISFSLLALLSCNSGGGKKDTVTETPLPPPPTSSTTTFNLGVSDAPVDNAEAVVITIDSITFSGDGLEDVVFETFNNEAEGLIDEETVTIDLLQFQGSGQFTILENAEIPPGTYEQAIIKVLDENIDLSYVTETGGENKSIKVPSDNLKLGSVTFNEGAEAMAFTVEFSLRKSMTYKPGPDEYNLKPRGVRIVNNDNTGTVSGIVDVDVINQDISCLADSHLIYLYSGIGLDADNLADGFDSDETNNGAPESAIAPFDVIAPSYDDESASYLYEFGFVPSGDYTIAYACNTGEEGDDPDVFDGIGIPYSEAQLTEITVVDSMATSVDFPIIPST